ncbi:MAG: bifunctional UDP-sugar hydrolase/5'-nucleotidase [bacterium]|nr:bifunctional UDP-sugar hydrolase/5'-nucleotidase [bacterium]
MTHFQRTTPTLALFLLATTALAQPRPLTILHVNDLHTRYLPEEAAWSREDPKPLIGGMVALQDAVARERAASEAVLVLDAGDWLTGTPLSEVEAAGVEGGAFLQMMNAVGFDASTIGNHDFDNGVAALEQLIALAEFPVVSANLARNGVPLAPAPWVVLERGGLRVGVVGLILEDLADEISPALMAGIEVRPVAEAARAAVVALDPVTDFLILLTHQGWQADSLLATRVEGVDLIVGGHSHTRLREPRLVNGVLVAQAGSYARDLGRIDLMVEHDRVVSHQGRLIPLYERDVASPDPVLAGQVAHHRQQIDAEYAVVVGRAAQALGRSYYLESPLGNWMCDALRGLTDADVALLNSGGLRADLAAGPIMKLDIKQILPFRNTIALFNCTGVELLTILRTNAEASLRETQGILQLSGVACTYRDGAQGAELVEVRVGGRAVDPAAIYHVATADYVLSLADKYLGFTPTQPKEREGTLFTAVCAWLEAHPEVIPPVGGRFTRLP